MGQNLGCTETAGRSRSWGVACLLATDAPEFRSKKAREEVEDALVYLAGVGDWSPTVPLVVK